MTPALGHQSPGRSRRARTNTRGHPWLLQLYSSEGLLDNPFGDLLGKDINDILQLMDRSLSFDLVHRVVGKRRGATRSSVLEILPDLRRGTIQQSLLFIGGGIFKWIEPGLLADQDDNFGPKCVTALVTAYTRGSDERWSSVMMCQLGVSEPVLQQYLTQGDNVLFLNLLSFLRWPLHPYNPRERAQCVAQI